MICNFENPTVPRACSKIQFLQCTARVFPDVSGIAWLSRRCYEPDITMFNDGTAHTMLMPTRQRFHVQRMLCSSWWVLCSNSAPNIYDIFLLIQLSLTIVFLDGEGPCRTSDANQHLEIAKILIGGIVDLTCSILSVESWKGIGRNSWSGDVKKVTWVFSREANRRLWIYFQVTTKKNTKKFFPKNSWSNRSLVQWPLNLWMKKFRKFRSKFPGNVNAMIPLMFKVALRWGVPFCIAVEFPPWRLGPKVRTLRQSKETGRLNWHEFGILGLNMIEYLCWYILSIVLYGVYICMLHYVFDTYSCIFIHIHMYGVFLYATISGFFHVNSEINMDELAMNVRMISAIDCTFSHFACWKGIWIDLNIWSIHCFSRKLWLSVCRVRKSLTFDLRQKHLRQIAPRRCENFPSLWSLLVTKKVTPRHGPKSQTATMTIRKSPSFFWMVSVLYSREP